jgi:hypothetical protein
LDTAATILQGAGAAAAAAASTNLGDRRGDNGVVEASGDWMRVPTNRSTSRSTVTFGDDGYGVIRRRLVFSSLASRMAERGVRLRRWDARGEVSVGGVPDGDSGDSVSWRGPGMMLVVEW